MVVLYKRKHLALTNQNDLTDTIYLATRP